MHFMITVVPVEDKRGYYTFSLSFKAGGLHRSLCEPVTLKLAFDPQQLNFNVLYAVLLYFPSGVVDSL
jgi:hypothetical protein